MRRLAFLLFLLSLPVSSITAADLLPPSLDPHFRTLIASSWSGKWVWDSGGEKPVNYYLHVRKTFDLPRKPSEAPLRICADSRYKLFVNGRFAGRGPVRSDPRWQYYDVYDIAPYLRPGKNVIAALVHHYGTNTFTYHLGRGGFLCDGAVSCAADRAGKPAQVRLATDESWRVLPSKAWFRDIPRMDVQLEFNEIYDANQAADGWTEAGFDDSGWQQAKVIGPVGTAPWTGLVPRDIPDMYEQEIFPVKVHEAGIADPSGIQITNDNKMPIARIMGQERKDAAGSIGDRLSNADALCRRPSVEDIFAAQPLDPNGLPLSAAEPRWKAAGAGRGVCTVQPLPASDIKAGKGTYVVLDFGREVCGHPRISIRASGGGIVDLGYSELLIDGKVDPHRAGVNYADRYVMKPGRQTWETFDRRAFRYMQLDFRECTGPVVIDSVSVNFSTYPVQWRGSFECSDSRLNDIWRIGAYTVQLNMEDAYTDCPWRERTQWWGDARVEALSNYYAFGDPWLIRKGIKQIGQSQSPAGMTMCFYPGVFDNPIPSFSLYWVMSAWDYYLFTGDRSIVDEIFPKVKKLIDWFEARKDPNGLPSGLPHWTFVDWTNTDLRDTVTTVCCLYYQALRNASSMGKLVNDTEAALVYAKRADEVKSAINDHLFLPARGMFPEYYSPSDNTFSRKISQIPNGMAAGFGICQVDRSKTILANCLDPANQVIPAGVFTAYYLLEGMLTHGMIQQSLDYMRTNWGRMLDHGATTLWEQWGAGNSLCHGWASAPTVHLPAWILGVKPTEPGFRRVDIAPNTGSLTWARGVVPSPRGDIVIAWKNSEQSFAITISVPGGVAADLALPIPAQCKSPTTRVNGRTQLPAGVTAGKPSPGRVSLTVAKQGRYSFVIGD